MSNSNTEKIGADYSLRPSEMIENLTFLVEHNQPAMIWGPPGCAKSDIAKLVAKQTNRIYIDIRALLLDPVDLRGLPWRDPDTGATRWAPPVFLPDSKSDKQYLINLEELPSAPPMVQAALYQLVLDRACGEYTLPPGASLIACGNREGDRAISRSMPTPLASRFTHLEISVDAADWCAWGAQNDIAPEVLFFMQFRPDLLHHFDTKSTEKAFPCPRTWEFVSNMLKNKNGMSPQLERSMYVGTVGEAAAIEFMSFVKLSREMPHPEAVLADPTGADIPDNPSVLIALCGALYRLADDTNFGSVVDFGLRLRAEIAEFMIGACIKRDSKLQTSDGFIKYAAAKSTR